MTSVVRNQKVNSRKLEKAKEFRGNMTCAEKMLWERLRGNKLDGLHFRRQQVIEGYIVDFYCHSARLVIEVDGKIHERQKSEDQLREQALIDKGLKILRIRNEEIQSNIQNVLGKILEICHPNR